MNEFGLNNRSFQLCRGFKSRLSKMSLLKPESYCSIVLQGVVMREKRGNKPRTGLRLGPCVAAFGRLILAVTACSGGGGLDYVIYPGTGPGSGDAAQLQGEVRGEGVCLTVVNAEGEVFIPAFSSEDPVRMTWKTDNMWI